MKITALVENTTKSDCPTEHGLSLYIETARHNILFDTGQTTLFADNAERFGVDLSSVDLCMLSHGHYDHGGGLKKFTLCNDHAKIYMNK
nr:MBL fold metallo-hydrolase [Lachnospiraceae bacterium]